jgi:transcriptional regulatory protein LevR
MADDNSFEDSPFAERFTLLLASNQITHSTLQLVVKIIEQIENELDITLTEDNGEMLVSHLGLALQRIADGEAIKETTPVLIDEAQSVPAYWQLAGRLIQIANEALNTKIEPSEQAYLTMHLAALAINSGR